MSAKGAISFIEQWDEVREKLDRANQLLEYLAEAAGEDKGGAET